jgi:hypothetical protein
MAEYLSAEEAILSAGKKRFRAILLTTLTTFVGLFPLLFETSVQAQFVIPMALSLSFGILFASTITLVLIPCLYLVVETNHRFISALLLLLLLIAASFLMAFVGLFSLGVGTTISVLLLVIMIGLAVRKALGHFPETQAPV